MYLGMSESEANGEGLRGTDEGGKLKEEGTEHWIVLIQEQQMKQV